MDSRKVVLVAAGALLAAYFGARMAAPQKGSLALAAGAGAASPREGLVTVTTGAQGPDSNRLVMVDTNRKRIMVYRVWPNYMRLIAVRPYDYDLKLGATLKARGNGFGYLEIKKGILNSKLLTAKQKQRAPRGREMVLTTDGAAQGGNRIILINPVEKRILVYRLKGHALWLIAARPYDYDERVEYTEPDMTEKDGGYEVIRKKVDAADKAHAAKRR